jgi:hypothetical protein
MARILTPSKIAFAMLVILILIGIALVAGYALLPTYLEKRLLPKLAADVGLSDVGLEVRRVGFFGADLEKIRLGPASNPGLILDNMQIDYTPEGLLNKKIDRIVVNGILLSFRYQEGQLQLDKSLASLFESRPSRQTKTTGAGEDLLPFERLVMRHARVRLTANGSIYTVPLQLDLIPDKSSANRMTVGAVLWPRDQRLKAVAQINLEAGTADIQTSAAALKLKAFADFLDPAPGLQLGGMVDIESKVTLAFSPLKISMAEATLRWSGDGIQYNNLRIRPGNESPNGKSHWQLRVVTIDGGRWQIKADPILAESRLAIQLAGLEARIQPTSTGYQLDGQISASLVSADAPETWPRPFKLIQSPRIDGCYHAAIDQQTGWSFSFNGKPSQPRIKLDMGGDRLNALLAAFQVSGRGDSDQMTIEYDAALNGLRFRSKTLDTSVAAVSVKGKTSQSPGSPDRSQSELRISVANAAGGTDQFQFDDARAGFFGTVLSARGENPQIIGNARFSAAKLSAEDASVRVSKITGRLPLTWPPPVQQGKAGSFRIAMARFQRYQLADLTGAVRQTPKGVVLEGRHSNAVIPGLELKFAAMSRLTGQGAPAIDFSASAERSPEAAPIDLGVLMPGGEGVRLSGRLEASIDLHLDAGGISGKSTLRLTGGQVQAAKEDFNISGLRLGLEIPGLPVLRSAPGQELSFTSAQLGDIRIENGRIHFQIEPAPAVLLEKGQFDWSEGQVDMHSTRIYLDRGDYELTLFCDRLNLAVLLEQFGAANAEGNGTVSGKIPIRYRNQKWSVADGFLYSSPGEGGEIRVQGTEILTAGIPKDSPQYMQLEIAREALKDYDFEWAKLTISTEGDDMLMKLQLDGKPAGTLPFAFRKDIGSFARVEGQAQGSNFQGIRLDVNFRLPLNKILQYKSIIQMMRKKGAK